MLKLKFNCFLFFSLFFSVEQFIDRFNRSKKNLQINKDISCLFFSLRYMCFHPLFSAVHIAQTGNTIPEGWTDARRNVRESRHGHGYGSRGPLLCFSIPTFLCRPLCFFPFSVLFFKPFVLIYFTSANVLFAQCTAFIKIKTANICSKMNP